MSINDLYFTTCDLYQSVRSSRDSIGGEVRVATLDIDDLPCYITALSAREVAAYGKMERTVTHRMFCNPIDISTADLVLWKSQWYDIVFAEDACQLAHHLEVLLSITDAPIIVEDESSSSSSSSSSASSESSESSSP